MKCEACETNNPDNSKFCIECGVLLKIEQKQIPDGFKKELEKWRKDPDGFSPPFVGGKLKNPSPVIKKEIQEELEKWKNDPWYMSSPLSIEDNLRAVRDSNSTISYPNDYPDIYPDICSCDYKDRRYVYSDSTTDPLSCKNCGWINTKHHDFSAQAVTVSNKPPTIEDENKEMLNTLQRSLSIEDNLRNNLRIVKNVNINVGSPKNDIDRRLSEMYPKTLKICGICGTTNCATVHIPSVQQQYKEAFENIQKIRRRRLQEYDRLQMMMKVRLDMIKAVNEPPLYSLAWLLKNRNKPFSSEYGSATIPPAIRPRDRPPKVQWLRKGYDNKKPPKKMDPIKDHVIKKEYLPKWLKNFFRKLFRRKEEVSFYTHNELQASPPPWIAQIRDL